MHSLSIASGYVRRPAVVQRAQAGPGRANDAGRAVRDVLRSPGQPLDAATRAFMEPRFGHDFSRVRVHADGTAADSARSVQALAYTVGQDIVFGAGQYQPATREGRNLIAHELTHTLQQAGSGTPDLQPAGPGPRTRRAARGGGRVPGLAVSGEADLEVGRADDALEREADRTAAQVLAGFTGTLAPGGALNQPRVQRQADPKLAPAGLPCEVDEVFGGEEGTNLEHFIVNKSQLSGKHREQLKKFVAQWKSDGASDFISVDGYASMDGPQELNWRLSCDRAETVQAELIRLGVPKIKVITFAHGETGRFSKASLDSNRRVVVNTIKLPKPEDAANIPNAERVTTKKPGELTDDGQVKEQPTTEQKPVGNQNVPVKPVGESDEDRLFSTTFEFDIGNNWFLGKQPPPDPNQPQPPFLCDHGVFQVGGKINIGWKLDKKGRFTAFNEPELDISVIPLLCKGNPGVTAQIDLLKFKILGEILEADLEASFGFPDNWSKGLSDFPFTKSWGVKGQFMPFGAGNSALKNLKIIVFGNAVYSQGVPDQPKGWSVNAGLGLGYEFDFGPVKKPEKE